MKKIAALLILLFSISVLVGTYVLLRPAMPRSKLDQIRLGMSQSEVRTILGSPQEEREEQWFYSRWGNPGYVAVSFDTSGHVIDVNDESAFR